MDGSLLEAADGEAVFAAVGKGCFYLQVRIYYGTYIL